MFSLDMPFISLHGPFERGSVRRCLARRQDKLSCPDRGLSRSNCPCVDHDRKIWNLPRVELSGVATTSRFGGMKGTNLQSDCERKKVAVQENILDLDSTCCLAAISRKLSAFRPEQRLVSRSTMTALVARTGRHQQRYEQGYRLVAGCIPYRVGSSGLANGNSEQNVEVLMITSQRGSGLLFPKGGWETDETMEEAALREALEEAGVRGILKEKLGTWDFKSKRQQGEFCPEGLCRVNMFALSVIEQLDTWPEQHARQRQWFSLADAREQCRVEWMQDALDKCKTHLAMTPTSVSPSTDQHSNHYPNHLPSQGRSLT